VEKGPHLVLVYLFLTLKWHLNLYLHLELG
jgi:hypothetical protein